MSRPPRKWLHRPDRGNTAAPEVAPAWEHPQQRRKPRFWARCILSLGDIVIRRLYPCSVSDISHYTAGPGTLVVSNHRRDVDGPLLGSILLRRHRGRLIAPFPHFVAREDLFGKGFLAHYLRNLPDLLRPLLARINLSPILLGCGTGPITRTHERSVAEALQDVMTHLGDMSVSDALRPQSMAIVAAELLPAGHATPISELLRSRDDRLWRRRHGYRHLRLSVFRRIKPCLHEIIEQQLDYFADALARGQMLVLEPEGRVSRSGHLLRPRAAMHELITRVARPVRVLPVSLTFDSMTTGSARIFVDIQPELTELRGLERRQIDERVMTAIQAGCRITGGQLAAGFFLFQANLEAAWPESALVDHMVAAAQRCTDAGLRLDPCLQDPHDCEQRTRDILAWGLRKNFLTRDDNNRLRIHAPDMPPPWFPDGPSTLLGYLRAELLDTAGEALARDLKLVP